MEGVTVDGLFELLYAQYGSDKVLDVYLDHAGQVVRVDVQTARDRFGNVLTELVPGEVDLER